jgi:hypothetical protein
MRVALAAIVCVIVAIVPAKADEVVWKGPGWYLRSMNGPARTHLGGPFADKASCRAAGAEMMANRRNDGTSFYCSFDQGDQKFDWRWNGTGWYAADLERSGVLHGGPFEDAQACRDAVAVLAAREPDVAADCLLHEESPGGWLARTPLDTAVFAGVVFVGAAVWFLVAAGAVGRL